MKTSRQLRERELYIDRVTKHPQWTERRIHSSVQKELNKTNNKEDMIHKNELLIVKLCAAALTVVITLNIFN